jgi:hypothetical protein
MIVAAMIAAGRPFRRQVEGGEPAQNIAIAVSRRNDAVHRRIGRRSEHGDNPVLEVTILFLRSRLVTRLF